MLRNFLAALCCACAILLLSTSSTLAQQVETRDVTVMASSKLKEKAAGETVMATYCVNGEITYRSATVDARGNVTWKDLPRVRTIMWNKEDAALVI
jgi:outer membrane biogenesis lipoprotein LolB